MSCTLCMRIYVTREESRAPKSTALTLLLSTFRNLCTLIKVRATYAEVFTTTRGRRRSGTLHATGRPQQRPSAGGLALHACTGTCTEFRPPSPWTRGSDQPTQDGQGDPEARAAASRSKVARPTSPAPNGCMAGESPAHRPRVQASRACCTSGRPRAKTTRAGTARVHNH